MGLKLNTVCLAALVSGSAMAQSSITVANYNFSTPSVAEGTPFGDTSGSDVPGWNTSILADGVSSGIYNPTTDQYSNPGILDINGGVIGTMGAGNNQALFLQNTTLSYQQFLSEQVVPGMTYILTVAVGGRDNGEDFAGYVISLGADSVLATVADFDAPAAGSFGDVTLTYTATESDTGFLNISLGGVFDTGSVDFTNVRLETVPEASTWAAIGFVGLLGASAAWRQRQRQTAKA
ncbi:MAG TPA: hypothetical protein VMF06_21585 [Candidatus Limnocylindria bacterium]|jgi:hypothetical protein|nr:hypothetical protein [Candidatus Limnocylindria bacterium]